MKNNRLFSIGILFILFLTSCATQNLFVLTEPKEYDKIFFYNSNKYEYKIRKDDKLNVSVWDHDDLSVGSIYSIYNANEVYGRWLMVDQNGYINIPKIGTVYVLDLTVSAAKDTITNRLKKWIVNPIIDVKILNKEITVMGEFKSPGKFIIEKETNTLLEMIAKAGDFDAYANKKTIQVIRVVNNQPRSITLDLTNFNEFSTSNIVIYPGDVIYAPAKKSKQWDKRAGSTIVPISSAISSAVLIYGIIKQVK